jgi:TolB protein
VLQNGTDLRQLTDKSGRDDLPTWSPDGTKVGWVHGKEFWVHDNETGRQRMVSSIEGVSSAVVWSPSGSKLAFSRQTPPPEGKSDIFVMDADGANQTNITDTRSGDELEVDWSPDGSKLAYTKIDWSPRVRGAPTSTSRTLTVRTGSTSPTACPMASLTLAGRRTVPR